MKSILKIALTILTIGLVACEDPYSPIIPNTTIASLGTPADNEIWFTTIDGRDLMALNGEAFNAEITDVEYIEFGVNVIRFDAPLTTIGDSAFDNCRNINNISLPESVTTIGKRAFFECTQLECMTLGANIQSCGAEAFDNCVALHSLHIASIGLWCQIKFENPTANPIYHCGGFIVNGKRVKDVAIPSWVSEIGAYTFYNYATMASVKIPSTIKSIGKDAFYGCEALSAVDIESVTEWCKIKFANTYSNPISTAGTILQNGQSISTLSIKGVENIVSQAFMGCSNITSFVTDNTLQVVGEEVIRGSAQLSSVVLGKSVTEIKGKAFMGCMVLERVECHAVTPPTLGDKYVFDYNAANRKIYVPRESLDTYKAHEAWSRYADSIEALN